MNTNELNEKLEEAFQLMQIGKIEFLSGFDLKSKTFGYEKMNFAYQCIVNYEQKLNTPIDSFSFKQEIEEFNKQINKFKELLFIQNITESNDIGQLNFNLQSELDWIQVVENPNVGEDKIIQLTKIKNEMKEIALPFKYPQLFQNSTQIFEKILLYGPPNSGKKYLVELCATIANATLISLSIQQLIEKYYNKPCGIIKNIFKFALKKMPSIILIQDLDLLRNLHLNTNRFNLNIITELLIELDKQRSSACATIQVIGTTSYPWMLEPSIRRRFSRKIYIPTPNNTQIVELLNYILSDMNNNLTQEQLDNLTGLFDGYTTYDILNILRMAQKKTQNCNIQENNIKKESIEPTLQYVNILNVLQKFKQTTSQDYKNKCTEWQLMFNN